MTTLLNVATGKPEDVDAASEALARGTHVPIGGRALLDPDGKLGIMPDDVVHDAVTKYGYRLPTQADLTEHATQQKYGEGTANEMKAFGAGALRGATFGISDASLPALGVSSQEALREREARNPAASVSGELAGAVGSAVLAPEASPVGLLGKAGAGITKAVAPAALEGGASVAARILHGAQEVGARALGSAVEGAAFGAGKSVSEAALGAPDLTAEKVLANIGYGAAIGGGIGTLLKAGEIAIPASFDTAKGAVQRSFNRFIGRPAEGAASPEPVLKLATAVEGGPEEAAAAAAGAEPAGAAPASRPPWNPEAPLPRFIAARTGVTPEEAAEGLEKQFSSEMMTPKEFDAQARDMTKGMQEHYDSMRKLEKEGFLARVQERGSLLKDVPRENAVGAVERLKTEIEGQLNTMRPEPELYAKSAVRELEILRSSLDKATDSEESIPALYERLDQARGQLYDLQKKLGRGTASYPENKAAGLVQEVYGQAKALLADEGVWGAQGARQAAFNEAYNAYRTARTNFEKAFGQDVATRSGGTRTVIRATKLKTFLRQANDVRSEVPRQALQDYLETSKVFLSEVEKTHAAAPFENFDGAAYRSLIDRAQGQAMRAHDIIQAQPGGFGAHTDWFHPLSAVAQLGRRLWKDPESFAGMLANLERSAGKTTNTVSAVAKAMFRPVGNAASKGIGVLRDVLTPAEKLQRFKDRVDEIQSRGGTPEALIDHVDQATRDGFDVAPKVTQALQMAMIRGHQFLMSKIPHAPGPVLPFDRKWEPSQAEVASFDRYYDAVHDPLQVLRELKAGKVRPETLEAVGAVYPRLLTEMRQEVLSELTAAKGKDTPRIPYQRQLVLQDFLGMPLSSAASAQGAAAAQTATQGLKNRAAANDAVRTSQKGLQRLDLADRTRTSQQDAAQRERV